MSARRAGIEREVPGRDVKRWTPALKAQVVRAVKAGAIDAEYARTQWNVSAEELQRWVALFDSFGAPALRVTRTNVYREQPKRASPPR